MIVVRAGAHTGAFDHAFMYVEPRAHSLSRFGVTEYSSPVACRCGPVSSQVIHRMFGRDACAAFTNGAVASEVEKARRVIILISPESM